VWQSTIVNPERPTIEELIGHEVHRPDLVRFTGRWSIGAVTPGAFTLGQLGPDDQAFFAIQPVNTLLVHGPALPSQQNVEAAIAIADAGGSELLEPHAQRGLGIGALTITLRRSMEAAGAARPPLTDAVGLLQMACVAGLNGLMFNDPVPRVRPNLTWRTAKLFQFNQL